MLANFLVAALLFPAFIRQATAQVTLSGCHLHGDVEYISLVQPSVGIRADIFRYCYLPNGEETAISTAASTTALPATPSPTGPTSVAAATTAEAQTTAVTDCHMHEATQYEHSLVWRLREEHY
jgi:zinc transporter 1/2/3